MKPGGLSVRENDPEPQLVRAVVCTGKNYSNLAKRRMPGGKNELNAHVIVSSEAATGVPVVLDMTKSNLLRTDVLNLGDSHAVVAAVTTILDNIVLHLTRYDLEKATPLAEMLMGGRLREHRLGFDVLQASALASALRRGLVQIRRLAPLSALIEFRQAQDIWSRDTRQAANDDTNSAVQIKAGQGMLVDNSLVAG